MAPGVLGIGTTAYISAHNQVNHTVWLPPLDFHTCCLLDSCPCKSLPHLSKRLQPGAGWQVGKKIGKSTFEFQGWCHLEYPLGGARGSKRPNSCGGDFIGKSSFIREHLQASETVMQFSLGWFAKPILVDGRYPEVV